MPAQQSGLLGITRSHRRAPTGQFTATRSQPATTAQDAPGLPAHPGSAITRLFIPLHPREGKASQ